MSLYRHETHVPLLIVPPASREAMQVVDEPVSLRDLPTTCLDLLGLKGRSPFPGQSLARFWHPGAAEDRPASVPLLSEVEHRKVLSPAPNVPAFLGPVKSLVDRGKVYIVTGDGREELYDLDGDPLETHNLIHEAGSRPSAEHFRRSLSRLLETPKARRPAPPDRGEALAERDRDE